MSLWKEVLPAELLKLLDELARVDGLIDDPVYFAPIEAFRHDPTETSERMCLRRAP